MYVQWKVWITMALAFNVCNCSIAIKKNAIEHFSSFGTKTVRTSSLAQSEGTWQVHQNMEFTNTFAASFIKVHLIIFPIFQKHIFNIHFEHLLVKSHRRFSLCRVFTIQYFCGNFPTPIRLTCALFPLSMSSTIVFNIYLLSLVFNFSRFYSESSWRSSAKY